MLYSKGLNSSNGCKAISIQKYIEYINWQRKTDLFLITIEQKCYIFSEGFYWMIQQITNLVVLHGIEIVKLLTHNPEKGELILLAYPR